MSAGTLPDLVGVRDVVEVDGHPLHGGERSTSADRCCTAPGRRRRRGDAAARRGGRFNLAEGSRNLNLPTLALFFLHPETQSRFNWSRQSPASATTWVFKFKERAQPTIIHTGDGEPVFCKGLVEIETATRRSAPYRAAVHFDKLDYTLMTTFDRVASSTWCCP